MSLLLTGCGGAAAPGVGHDSPAAAAAGFVASAHGAAAAIIPWLAPSDRHAFDDLIAFNRRSNLVLSLRTEQVVLGRAHWTSPERAEVGYRGQILACTAGKLPAPDSAPVDECRPILLDASGHGLLHLVLENAAWYVFFDIGSGGDLSGPITPPPPAPR
ncbi:MAG: hypothetical protein NVSMB29_03680 [Candidatus Dormibacteria bacterium]